MYDCEILGKIHCATTQTNRRRLTGVTSGVCGFCLLGSAIASPPTTQEGSSLSVKDLVRSMSVASRPVVRQDMPSARFDLRAPRDFSPTIIRGSAILAHSHVSPRGLTRLMPAGGFPPRMIADQPP